MRIEARRAGVAGLALSLVAVWALAADTPGAYSGKPYGGHPQTIPGRVQAELYDSGGPEVAYHDSDPGNNGSGTLNKGNTELDQFRKDEGVDISYTKQGIDATLEGQQETVGELYLGWTAPGEWVKYTVDVKQAGTYRVRAHLSSNNPNAEISLSVDGVDQTGPIVIAATGHWHKWRIDERLAEVKLERGVHVLTLSILKEGNMNIDYLEFIPAGQTSGASSTH
jgi:hypothetical protein